MQSPLSLLLVFLSQFFIPRHNAQLRLLKAQITVPQSCIPTRMVNPLSAEKREQFRVGAEAMEAALNLANAMRLRHC